MGRLDLSEKAVSTHNLEDNVQLKKGRDVKTV